jgi:hypothetical protein
VRKLVRHHDCENGFRWPVSSLGDLYGAERLRRNRWRLKVPRARRARLILQCLERRRFWERRGWSGFYLEFQMKRGFQSSGMKWSLFSALYFGHREGLYWVCHLCPRMDSRQHRRLRTSGYYARVTKDLRRMGFRVQPPGRNGVVFDQDFLPSKELITKALLLTEWRPPQL